MITAKISKFGIPREVLQISCGIKLECPDYKGNNLDDEFVKELSKVRLNKTNVVITYFCKSKRKIFVNVLEFLFENAEIIRKEVRNRKQDYFTFKRCIRENV